MLLARHHHDKNNGKRWALWCSAALALCLFLPVPTVWAATITSITTEHVLVGGNRAGEWGDDINPEPDCPAAGACPGVTWQDTSDTSVPNGQSEWNAALSSTSTSLTFDARQATQLRSRAQSTITTALYYHPGFRVTVNVAAAAGESWQLLVDVDRIGTLQRVTQGSSNPSLTLGALSATVSGATVSSGSLNLGAVNPAANTTTAVNQNNQILLSGSGSAAVVFTLNFDVLTKITGQFFSSNRGSACWSGGLGNQGSNAQCSTTANAAHGVFLSGQLIADPVLTLQKTVVNNSGGTAVASDFTLQAAGPVTISGISGASAVTNATVPVGIYTLTETGPAGYTGSWSCTAGTLVGNSLTLAANQAAVCTVTNDDQPATLTLQKTVVNDHGGTALDTDFTLIATGPTSISGVEGSAAVTAASVSAGTYTLSESGPAGYSAGSWSCTAGTLVGSSLTLANGEAAVCTIINDDQPATLTLQKTVINDHGGTAVDTDFTLIATGPTSISGVEGSAAVTAASVSAGTYTLSESGPAGYTASNWSCTAGTLVGSSLTLVNGEAAVCTIVNDDLPTLLTLNKTVIGGSAVDTDFTLTATGPVTISGVEGSVAITAATVPAGTYVLSESGGPAGYTREGWSCTAGTLVGNSVQIALGNSVVCTVTNRFGALQISKTPAVISDGHSAPGFAKAIPGATVRYTILLDNSAGADDAEGIELIDDFQDGELSYVANSVQVGGTPIADGGSSGGVSVSAQDAGGAVGKVDRIRVNGLTVPQGSSVSVTFDVLLD